MTDRPPDPYLAQHVRDALARATTAELGVDVVVTDAGVFLSGVVASAEQRAELVAVARSVVGDDRPVLDDLGVVHGDPDPEIEVLG